MKKMTFLDGDKSNWGKTGGKRKIKKVKNEYI